MAPVHTIASALSLLAALAVVCAGLAWTLGIVSLRDRLLRLALFLVATLVCLPVAGGLVGALASSLGAAGLHVGGGTLTFVVLGHVALAAVLLRRRFRGDAVRRRAEEMARARTRSRARLLPDSEERDR